MQAFIIRPFGQKTDAAGTIIDFEAVHAKLIEPALKAAGLDGGTTGQIIEAGNIREDMFALIIEADLVVADVTIHNANVFYELGVRHALRKRCSVLIKGKPVTDDIPFDLLTDRYQTYQIADPSAAVPDLTATLKATLGSLRETDSPIFKMLPRLPETNTDAIQVVPTDFTEELGRARVAKSPGWLRLLAEDSKGLRFELPALRLIAQAQLELKDYEGARQSWERVRSSGDNDVTANLALANIYQRQSEKLNQPALLEASNQAIARALSNDGINSRLQSEAQGLKGRNLKALWGHEFQSQESLAARRQAAISSRMLETYEAYRDAYLIDLNGYWPGLAALQQGVIALDLAADEAWADTFDDAEQRKGELTHQIAELRPIVTQAVENAIARALNDEDRMWAKISAADLRFLGEERPGRVIRAYRDAIPSDNAFAWDAAKGQLCLFSSLGVRAELADKIVREIDPLVAVPNPEPGLHIVIFAGHQIDQPGREQPRFPAEREEQARMLIRQRLERARDATGHVALLASAAPGADIICHEVCRKLGIESTLCLPMPKEDYARSVFGELDGWRSRFLELSTALSGRVLTLSDQVGLPRWLQRPDLNPWERGFRWVLQMAQTSGAAKMTLIALWDGKTAGDEPGATAHMVKLARDAGNIDVMIIETAELLREPTAASALEAPAC